ncbi:ABC transporter permease subunit [Massilia sp. Dwa41.01b]|uniref:PstA family ABC transporter permease n=1 Tax=Massilia sp. Dwa41.01b TaxID=2709302 RepID=UPI001602F479|nr:ABC transporter permease subunit [Massilia sp. Dwa41.01b]QNA87267.1 ABC transporter permease subunit [Massilia sp. Dwa41.01b]
MRPWQILPRAALWLVVAAVAAAMLMPVIDIVIHGLPVLSWEFITENPRDAGRSGGIASVLVSTALITGVSLAAAVPVAFGTAVLLSEYVPADGLLASLIRGSLDVLAGVPSVVFGLFGLTLLCRQLGLGYSIVAGGLTLACMILPTLTRTMYSAFDALGTQYRFAGSALGVSRMAILLYVSLPLALPAVTAGIVLGLTRAGGDGRAALHQRLLRPDADLGLQFRTQHFPAHLRAGDERLRRRRRRLWLGAGADHAAGRGQPVHARLVEPHPEKIHLILKRAQP